MTYVFIIYVIIYINKALESILSNTYALTDTLYVKTLSTNDPARKIKKINHNTL